METYGKIMEISTLKELYMFGLNIPGNFEFKQENSNLTTFYTGNLLENLIDETKRPRFKIKLKGG